MQNLQLRNRPYPRLEEVRKWMEYSIQILQNALGYNIESPPSDMPPLTYELESLYRALANRYYYSVYEFFMWYSWEQRWERRNAIQKKGGRLQYITHRELPKLIEKNLTTPIRLTDPFGREEKIKGKDIAEEIEAIKDYRSDADYHLEVVFHHQWFLDLVRRYHKLRRVIEHLCPLA